MPETQEKKAIYELLFGIHNHGNNLYSSKIVKMKDNKVAEWKHGVETSMGHAITITEDLMGAWVLQSVEVSPVEFYENIRMI